MRRHASMPALTHDDGRRRARCERALFNFALVTRVPHLIGLSLSLSSRPAPPPHQQKNNIGPLASAFRAQQSGTHDTAGTGQRNHLRLLGLVLVGASINTHSSKRTLP